MTKFYSETEEIVFNSGKTEYGRPLWLYSKYRHSVKIIRLHDTFYIHRFKGYFVPANATQAELMLFFDYIAPQYDDMCFENRKLGDVLLKELDGSIPQIQIIDVMAGTGIPNEVLYKNGFTNQILVDISSGMLEVAKKKMPSIKTITSSFEQLNINEKFDCAISVLGMHYVSVPFHQFMYKLRSLVKERGLIYIIEPSKLNGFNPIKHIAFDWFNGKKELRLHLYVYRL